MIKIRKGGICRTFGGKDATAPSDLEPASTALHRSKDKQRIFTTRLSCALPVVSLSNRPNGFAPRSRAQRALRKKEIDKAQEKITESLQWEKDKLDENPGYSEKSWLQQ